MRTNNQKYYFKCKFNVCTLIMKKITKTTNDVPTYKATQAKIY